MTLDDALHRGAEQQPDKAAVLTAERSITYSELDGSVSCLARYFLDRGLRAGDRIAVHWSNSIEAVQLLLAAFRAGLVAVPVNLRLKPAEIAYIFEHSAARVCFSEPALAAIAEEAQRDSVPEVVSQLPTLTKVPGPPLPEVDPGQPAVILYTSGTTARPKGVTHTHRSLLETALITSASSDTIGHDDIFLAITPLMHASGLINLLTVLCQRATAVLLRTFDPAAALDLIERFRCTIFFGVPAMLQFMVEEQARHPRDVSSVRAVGAGGDTVAAALQRRFVDLFAIQLQEAYGLTESGVVTFNPSSDVRVGSIGPAASGVTIRLVDLRGNDVGAGETGEILVRSPANCVSYWNDPVATSSLFTDGWLHTGDLGSRDEDDYYWFKGRLKQLIIRGGSNISPQEVEEALYQHPAVREAGVVGAPHAVYGEIPVAFVALRTDHSPTVDQLQAHARGLVADYKVPERIFFLPELPKGPTGKVDRRRLRDILIAQSDLLEQRVVPGV
ncbi:MAG TPA: AMP-binding protein [Candidatus Solibacter sp.]|nr:AMP-binding protein [Candidatus Solibacter sp.]